MRIIARTHPLFFAFFHTGCRNYGIPDFLRRNVTVRVYLGNRGICGNVAYGRSRARALQHDFGFRVQRQIDYGSFWFEVVRARYCDSRPADIALARALHEHEGIFARLLCIHRNRDSARHAVSAVLVSALMRVYDISVYVAYQ